VRAGLLSLREYGVVLVDGSIRVVDASDALRSM
jgi:hypothetical protein